MDFNILLTSFLDARKFETNNKFSVARNKPEWCKYRELQFLAPFDVNHKPILLSNFAADVATDVYRSHIENFAYQVTAYADELRDAYTARWDDIQKWLDELPDDSQHILCCWCPHSKPAKSQIEQLGYFACHTVLVGKMINTHRPDLIVQLDDDREQKSFSDWITWYFELPVKKIISGGQTGADQAGLEAGKQLKLQTGGWMPKGFITQDGPRPDMKNAYNIIEHALPQYPPRTFANVKDSDGTIRFAKDFNSAGEQMTLKAINEYKRPYIDVNIDYPIHPNVVRQWIRKFEIETLNIAGNAEKRAPGINEFVIKYVKKIFGVFI